MLGDAVGGATGGRKSAWDNEWHETRRDGFDMCLSLGR